MRKDRLFSVSVGLFFLFAISGNPSFALQAIDSKGNVIFHSGKFSMCGDCFDLYKLNGKTGAVVWKKTLPEFYFPQSLLLDKKNDIILIGGSDYSFIVKISGATGQTVWQADTSSMFIMDGQMDKNNNILVEAFVEENRYLLKFEAATGRNLWSQKID